MNPKMTLILTLLLLPMAAAQTCEVDGIVMVPAVEDLYLNLVQERAYDSEILLCEFEKDDREEDRYPGMSLIQFDVSDINFTEAEACVLLLKAISVERPRDEFAAIVSMPMDSSWTEESDIYTLLFNMLPLVEKFESGDYKAINMDFEGDAIFALDVSENMRAVKAGGDRISFILMAVGDSDYSVTFNSRETGEGPVLLVTPYPQTAEQAAQQTDQQNAEQAAKDDGDGAQDSSQDATLELEAPPAPDLEETQEQEPSEAPDDSLVDS